MGYVRKVSALVTAILAVHAVMFGDPGFGSLRKKKISLPVRQPGAVRLANTSIAFTGSSSSPAYARVQDSLLTTLETEMLGNEKTLVKKTSSAEAEWVLGLRVTAFVVAQPQQRVDTVGKNGAAYTRWTGSLRAAYQVLDHGGRSHDAGNVVYDYDKEFAGGAKFGKATFSRLPVVGRKKSAADREPRTVEDVQEILVDEVARQIAEKLGNTSKTIEAEIAVGEDHLNRAAEFMESRLWSRALDELDKTPEFSKPESEAYRQYDLGLAHEAMAYDAKVFKQQQTDLIAAQEYYDKALELNRKEKYFVTAVARMKDGLARYKAFEGQKTAAAVPTTQPVATQKALPVSTTTQTTAPKTPVVTAKAPSAAPAKASAPPSAPAKRPKTLVIGDVIEMSTSGVPEGQIVDIIQHSSVQFDPLDKDTAIAIARSKLSVTLQNELRKKVGSPLLSTAKSGPGK